LTYELDLQSQASQAQGRPSCQKSRSKVQTGECLQTNGRTQTRTLPNILSPLLRGRQIYRSWIVLNLWITGII